MILENDSISVVRDAIRRWVNLLSIGRFDEAARVINTFYAPCTAGLLVESIGRYSRKYRDAPLDTRVALIPKITSPNEMNLRGENLVIYVQGGNTVIEYDLPIENLWSDLTAKFLLKERIEGGTEMSLVDIRVL